MQGNPPGDRTQEGCLEGSRGTWTVCTAAQGTVQRGHSSAWEGPGGTRALRSGPPFVVKRGITPLPSRGHTQKPATGHGHGAKWVQSAFCLWHYFFKKWGTWLIKYFLTCKECRNGKSADPPNTTAEEVGRLSLSTPHPVDRNPKRRRPSKMPCGTATSPPSPPHFQPGTSFKGATSSDSTLCRVLPEHATCQLRCGKPRTQSPLT